VNTTCRAAHHCKCDECREFAAQYEFWRQGQISAGRALRVSAVGSIRRIHALQRLGWSRFAIGAAAGYSERWADAITRQTRVSPRTAAKVAEVYDAMCMQVPCPVTPAQRTAVTRAKNYAERQGWAAPLDWDDDEIDKVDGRPFGMEKAA
jgi:hypothetical protein